MRQTRRMKQGFTLIELMVVISIIAALAALLLPVIANLVESARARACTANLKAHGNAFFTYRNNNQGAMPSFFITGNPGEALGAGYGTADSILNTKTDLTTASTGIQALLGANAMQNMWLIMDAALIGGGEATYKCPNDRDWKSRTNITKYGWSSPNNYSYSIQFPYKYYTGAGATPDANWNWACPNGTVLYSTLPTYVGMQMYPENCIYMADRNPRKSTAATAGATHTAVGSQGWTAGISSSSNHDEGTCYVEKGGTNGIALPTTSNPGAVGIAKDDIYNSRAGTGIPNVASGFSAAPDPVGYAMAPCTDTVLWPLNAR